MLAPPLLPRHPHGELALLFRPAASQSFADLERADRWRLPLFGGANVYGDASPPDASVGAPAGATAAAKVRGVMASLDRGPADGFPAPLKLNKKGETLSRAARSTVQAP